ncbi:MAG TPA: ROK family transcriptional regulator [Candidatus Dormibacteraeota bacterium]
MPRLGAKAGKGSLAWLRQSNRERIIGALRERGLLTPSELARITGLSRTTVHTLVGELKGMGLLEEAAPARPDARGGRPAIRLALTGVRRTLIGVDFGHTHVQVAVADLDSNFLAERRTELDVNRRALEALDAAARMVEQVLAEAGVELSAVVGVGIGIPGPVDRLHGTAGSATILPGWVGLQIAAEMEARLGLPVEIENDANLGALGEMAWGAGRGCNNFAYIKAATGIGAGLVIEGRLLRGATGTAGEIGHTILDEGGGLCYCGNRGCLETLASGPAIIRLVSEGAGDAPTLDEVVERAMAGNPKCRRAIQDAGREIGLAVAGLCNLINPERVIVGGLMSRAGDLLLKPLGDSVRLHTVQAAAETVEVVPAQFGEQAELLGALALALQSASARHLTD